MSLDGGGISNSPGAEDTASAMEEDYCLYGRQRFQQQWATTGVFHAGVLRRYGVTGEPSLLRALKQTRMLGASFGTCFLGHFPTPSAAQKNHQESDNINGASGAAKICPSTQVEQRGADATLPFDSLLLGPVQPAEYAAHPHLARHAWHREVTNTWSVLQMPSEWCQAMNGVVTEMSWSTAGQRRRIQEQLELASFMCLRAVQVPLPFYTAEQDPSCADAEDGETGRGEMRALKGESGDALASTISPAEEDQRNIRVACLAADVLLRFIQQGSDVKVWVRCDACNPAHRYQMQRLRQAVLYGYTRHSSTAHTSSGTTLIYRINTPCSVTGTRAPTSPTATASGAVHTEAVSSLVTMLYFSNWHPRMLLPSEWFGEQVVCFECPPAPLLFACMAPHGVAPQQHPHYRPDAYTAEGHCATAVHAATTPMNAAVLGEGEGGEGEGERSPFGHSSNHLQLPYNASRRSSPARLPDLADNANDNDVSGVLSSTNYSFCDWGEDLAMNSDGAPGAASADATALHTPSPSHTRRSSVLQQRYTYVMPDDLHPLGAARWAGGYPPLVSVLTFLIELMRRRALPLFDVGFFDQYSLLNFLYFKAVEEPTRDVFAPFEGQLQLPLQPLGHQLSSGVYEVFERDARKYRQYREAVYNYVKDWYEAGPQRQHAWQNASFFERHGVMREVPMPSSDERVLHLVLLGCGRGPLIDECLHAVSALGVRLRLFAIEKNAPAAAFTRMRWAHEPEWAQLAYSLGHTLEVIVADGRHIARAAADGSVVLPADFGLCDVVVSELLGSLGDNELSPECLEAFHAQLLEVQARRGVTPNAHLTCIPQSYTAWIAPLMSSSLEAAVAEAAVKGLTIVPPHCHDRHAALDHSLLVTNLSRGITLADPQPCWTFTHDFGHSHVATSMDRSAELIFTVPPCGRCSGIAGYFSCVLYQPADASATATTISTAPAQRTEDMYSWFPCTFTLDPTQRAELHEVEVAAAAAAASPSCVSGSVAIHVHLSRKTSEVQRQVWYEWSVQYTDAATKPANKGAEAPAVLVHNRNGWASSMLL